MTRWQDLKGYWQARARGTMPRQWLPRTRRERKVDIKATRDGRRMRPPIPRKGLKFYDASQVRMFINGVELTGFDSVNYTERPRKVVNMPVRHAMSFTHTFLLRWLP